MVLESLPTKMGLHVNNYNITNIQKQIQDFVNGITGTVIGTAGEAAPPS